MLSKKAAKVVTLLVSLLIATAGYCAPTASVQDAAILSDARCPGDSGDSLSADVPDFVHVDGIYDSHLTNIADELLKPPADSPASLSVGATSLPPVPGALFMGLTGFLCVSLVKDRKVWMAALAGFLWAGQTGFSALPQLARHLTGAKQSEQLFSPEVLYVPELRHSDHPRSDIEGTRYIALLRYLAGIPTAEERPHVQRRAKPVSSRVERYLAPPFRRGFAPSTSIEYLVSSIHTICEVTKRLAYITERHFYFSPAFIFVLLPRGPPCQTWMRFFLFWNFELHSVFANTLITLR